MKSPWTPTLTKKQALAICGSLSNPSKMPGHGYAFPAYRCRLGSFLQQLPKAVCFHCYALRGRYTFPNAKAAMDKRLKSLTHPGWIDAVTTLIHRSKDRYSAGMIPAICRASSIFATSSPSVRTCRG